VIDMSLSPTSSVMIISVQFLTNMDIQAGAVLDGNFTRAAE
jgi:hypothetical protein